MLYSYAFTLELPAFQMNPVVMRVNKIFCWVVLSLLIQACGQTGPLYMPGGPAPIHVPEEQPEDEI